MLESYNKYNFGNSHIWLLGQGTIGPALLFMILKLFNINLNQITVIDMKPEEEIRPAIDLMVRILRNTPNIINIMGSTQIKKDNYLDIFKNLKVNDLIIDCANDINANDIINLCQQRSAAYVNSAIEEWDYKLVQDPYSYTIHSRLNKLRTETNNIPNKKFTAIVGSGCNPGMVSVWAQIAIDKINESYGNTVMKTAEELGIRTIHISEIDTQRSKFPKRVDEYCNTWGSTSEPLYEEALAPVELSLGTHEEIPKINVVKYDEKNKYLVLDNLAINTCAQSYTPLYGNYIGMLIRHEENITIGEKFSTYKNTGREIIKTYSPSVYYVYKPCNDTLASISELKDKNFIYQSTHRFLTDDIIDGRDELGLTFFLENGDIFWIGSLLDISEARQIFSNQFSKYMNATTVQVVGGYLSGIMFVMDKHKRGQNGLYVPEDMDYKKVFETMKPFYGDFIFKKLEKKEWDFRNYNRNSKFSKYSNLKNEQSLESRSESKWQLKDFLIDSDKIIGINRINYYKFK
jgi:homospermidine synthase